MLVGEGWGGRGGRDGGRDALDDGRELACLRAVDGVVALEELPHFSHSAQGLRDLATTTRSGKKPPASK